LLSGCGSRLLLARRGEVYRSGCGGVCAAQRIGDPVDDDDLEASLAGLSGLLTGQQPVQETLIHIAEFAVRAIPGAEGAGLTMLEDDRPQTVVASAEFVHAVDDVQYGLGEGPCLLAVETRTTQTSGSLGGEPRWPRFGPRVGRMGVHSVLSLPLLLPDRVVGALNVYAHAKDAFGSEAVRIGELFARPAAVSVHNAQILAQSQRLAEQLGAALVNRAVIDQALGVIMSRTGATSEQAFDRLRAMSQSQHLKVAEVSRALMDEAVRRARARKAAGQDTVATE
jgi:GAF domain-containing protein